MRNNITALLLSMFLLTSGPFKGILANEIAKPSELTTRQSTAPIDAKIAIVVGIDLAKSLRQKGQNHRAITALDYVEEHYGTSGHLLLMRGAIKQQAKLHKSAVTDLSQAIEMNVYPAEAYALRATSRFTLGDRKGAFEDLDAAFDVGVPTEACYLARGRIRFLDDQHKAALEDFNKLVQMNPSSSFYYTTRASCHVMLGNHDDTIRDSVAVIRLDPKESKAFYFHASASAKLGNWNAALADYENLVTLEGSAKAYAGRANCHLRLGNYQEAVNDATSALRLDPHFLMAVKCRAISYAKLGKTKEAQSDVALAKKLSRVAEKQER